MPPFFKEKAVVIKFGGSTATHEYGVNNDYFHEFFGITAAALQQRFSRFAFVIGGGKRVRRVQQTVHTNREKDQVALQILAEHAQQLSDIALSYGFQMSTSIPSSNKEAQRVFSQDRFQGIALGGLQIGQSTDTVAVTAAELFQNQGYDALLLILSNIAYIYTSDPNIQKNAKPIAQGNIRGLIQEKVLVDDPKKFVPGMNVTIDPVAVSMLKKHWLMNDIHIWFGHGMHTQAVLYALQHNGSSYEGTSLTCTPKSTKYVKT